jgi:type VI secretion system protein ImpB
MINEMQHWLGSNRPPRVQITYDVETLGSTVQAQLPFVAGIIGDFAADSTTLPPMAGRTFTNIDRDNFADVMAGIAPSLTLDAQPKYEVVRTPDGTTVQPSADSTSRFSPSLTFSGMDDFGPISIINQVSELHTLTKTRQTLHDLLSKLDTNPSAQGTLTQGLAALALTRAGTDLDSANANLTTPTTGTLAAFDKVAGTVITLEGTGPNATNLTNAKKAVDDAVNDPTTGFAALYTAARPATPPTPVTAADLQKAGDAAWTVATKLNTAITLLTQITSTYPPMPTDGSTATANEQARSDAEAAAAAASTFNAVAGQARLSGDSAVAAAQLS